MPNVSVLDFREPAENIMHRAKLLVSIGGTSVIEAAFFKLRVIQFGSLGISHQMPNVFAHSDLSTLSERINEVLATEFDNEEYERQVEIYVASAYDTGFRVNYKGSIEGGMKDELAKMIDFHLKEVDRLLAIGDRTSS